MLVSMFFFANVLTTLCSKFVEHVKKGHCLEVLLRIVDNVWRKVRGGQTRWWSSPIEQTPSPSWWQG